MAMLSSNEIDALMAAVQQGQLQPTSEGDDGADNAVAASAAHRFTAYHVGGDREGLSAFAASSVRWVFWPSLAATLLILAFGKPMLWLFGPAFVEAYPIMFVLAVGFIARSAVGPAERLLNMVGEQRRCALAYSIAIPSLAALTVVMFQALGLNHVGAFRTPVQKAIKIVGGFALLFLAAMAAIFFIWVRPPARPVSGCTTSTRSRSISGALVMIATGLRYSAQPSRQPRVMRRAASVGW